MAALTAICCLAMLAWSSWLIVFLPIPMGLGILAFLAYLAWTRKKFVEVHGSIGAASGNETSPSERIDDDMRAFFARNHIPRFGRPTIGIEERETLSLLLSRKGVVIESEVMAIFLDASCLRRDWLEFAGRLAGAKTDGVNAYEAYLNYIQGLDGPGDLLPFLQHHLSSDGKPHDSQSIQAGLERARTERKVRGMEQHLDAIKQGPGGIITLEMIDVMDPFLFQDLIGMVYESRGFALHATPKRGDQGADVIVERGGERLVIQSKLYAGNVGNDAVQEVVAARAHWTCSRAAVVTNQYFTPAALDLAASNGVELISRDKLGEMLDQFSRSSKDVVRLAALLRPAARATDAFPGHSA
ncbi:MAG TPA: restriction endonuclease [Planctomycetota bacterium]